MSGDRLSAVNRLNLIGLLRREAAYSGVWFADQLAITADELEARPIFTPADVEAAARAIAPMSWRAERWAGDYADRKLHRERSVRQARAALRSIGTLTEDDDHG